MLEPTLFLGGRVAGGSRLVEEAEGKMVKCDAGQATNCVYYGYASVH